MFTGVRTGFTGIYLIIYGAVLIVVVRGAPQGLMGILARAWRDPEGSNAHA
jgi:hypothetical protein